MKLPKTITLAGITITVEDAPGLSQSRKLLAEARYNEQKIIIDRIAASTDIVEQTFFHELCHWILYIMNEDEKRNDERHVDVFAHLLYQALKTAQYEENTDEPGIL